MTISLVHAAEPLSAPDRRTELAADEVRVCELRAGSGDEALFLFPGLACDPRELVPLVSAFVGSQHVWGVALSPGHGPQPVPSLERMAERALAAVREVQPSGPYLIGGYSFGGLLALELAQQLAAEGETVEQLLLIDAVYSERYWPRSMWLRALARRTRWRLAEIARMRPTRVIGELRLRSGRLVGRVRARTSGAPPVTPRSSSDADRLVDQAYAAIAEYRPRTYGGTITLIAPSRDRHFGCDTTRIWEGYADRILVRRIDADHLLMMHDQASAAAVAAAIELRLASRHSGIKPTQGFERPLVVTTMRWFSAARFAHSLVEAGFSVSVCRPNGHALAAVDGLAADYHLNRLWRRRSLRAAIRKARPDIILPDDERALSLLRRLHSDLVTDEPEIAALIAHSLGCSDHWPDVTSRSAFATEARSMTIAAPETTRIADADELDRWVAERNLPIVLKTDGSWGGRGVAVVREASQLGRAWRRVSGPPSLPRALKRTLFDLEAGHLFAWLRRSRAVVNVQGFVDGRDATVTVACLDGKVLAVRCFEVVQAKEPRGPAAVVQMIENPTMDEAVRRLVDRYRLSGFCGFDFGLTRTGEAKLLEMNPRVTPTAYLLVDGGYDGGRTITLFPPAAVSTKGVEARRSAPSTRRSMHPGSSPVAGRWRNGSVAPEAVVEEDGTPPLFRSDSATRRGDVLHG